MFLTDLFFAFVVAAVLSGLLVGVVGWRSPRHRDGALWPSLVLAFTLLVLVTWAGGSWLTPLGPALWGGYFFSFVFAGLIFALLIAALATPARDTPPEARDRREPPTRTGIDQRTDVATEAEPKTESMFGAFFFALVAAVLLALALRYA